MKTKIIALLLLVSGLCLGHAQGFINLNFEQASIVIDPGNGAYASNAIPGWTAYIRGVPQPLIKYDSMSLAAAAVTLEPTNGGGPVPQILGNYYVFVQGAYGFGGSAGIGQTGQIPVGANTLTFWGYYDNMLI